MSIEEGKALSVDSLLVKREVLPETGKQAGIEKFKKETNGTGRKRSKKKPGKRTQSKTKSKKKIKVTGRKRSKKKPGKRTQSKTKSKKKTKVTERKRSKKKPGQRTQSKKKGKRT